VSLGVMLVLMEVHVLLALLVGTKILMALVTNAWLVLIQLLLVPLALVLHAQQPHTPTLVLPVA